MRRVSKLFAGLLLIASSPPSAFADAARPVTARPQQRQEQAPSQFNRLVLNQLLNAIGRPVIQVRFNLRVTDQGAELRDLGGRVQLQFRRDVSFPIEEPTGEAQFDRLIPTVQIGTNGGSLVTRIDPDDANDRTRVAMTFVRPQSGNAVPVTIRAELVEFLALRIEGLQFTLSGLKSASGIANVEGTCSMKQAVVNAAGQSVWQPVDCRFSGRFDRNAQTYQVDFSYDSLER